MSSCRPVRKPQAPNLRPPNSSPECGAHHPAAPRAEPNMLVKSTGDANDEDNAKTVVFEFVVLVLMMMMTTTTRMMMMMMMMYIVFLPAADSIHCHMFSPTGIATV